MSSSIQPRKAHAGGAPSRATRQTKIHLSLNPGETLEIFQLRGTTIQTLVRVPATVTAIHDQRPRNPPGESTPSSPRTLRSGAELRREITARTGSDRRAPAGAVPVFYAHTAR
jgi:hypothetical protein